MQDKFVMKGKDRYYHCPLCNEDHPSVTTILDVIGSQALMGWRQKMGTKKLLMYETELSNHISNDLMKELRVRMQKKWEALDETSNFWKNGSENAKDAADHGTMAHAAFEMYLGGREVDESSLSEPARNAFGVFRSFAESNKIETLATEKTFYNCKIGYAGTADWVGRLNGKLTLSDHKTSTGIFEKNIIQVWANAIADEMMNGKNLYEQVAIWRFGKDGSTDILISGRNGRLVLNGKEVQESGYFGSYEQARVLIQCCVDWFKYKKKWESIFPYKRK